MTEQAWETEARRAAGEPLCPACGRASPPVVDGRCGACGERLADGDVTSDDHTPYAEALAAGRRGYRQMCAWVYIANKQRLRHLGLTRPSRASRRFARLSVLWLAMASALAVFANAGWHSGPSPLGKGWWCLVVGSAAAAAGPGVTSGASGLWWNLPWATIAGVGTFVLAIAIGFFLLWSVKCGAQRSLQGGARGAPRLICAVQYSTAWVQPIALGLLVMAMSSVARIAGPLGWLRIPGVVFLLPAVLLTVVGLLLWWLWCVRLGQVTPQETRAAVSRYFLIWGPLWCLLVLVLAAGGVWYLADDLMRALKLQP